MKTKLFLLRLLCLVLLAGLLFPPLVPVRAEGANFIHLSIEDGLSQSSVFGILQDQQGFMWFATQDGLNKFDGYTFTVFKHRLDDTDSLINNTINALFEDKSGSLWIGTNAGLDRLDRSSGEFVHFQHDPLDSTSLGGPVVHAITQDGSGRLWISTPPHGLSMLEPGASVFRQYRHDPNSNTSLSSDRVLSLHTDRQGRIWAGTYEGIDRYDRSTGAFRHYFLDSDPLAVYDVAEDWNGELWLATGNGLTRLNPYTGRVTHFRNNPDDPSSISPGPVRDVAIDREGLLWLATSKGLDQYDFNTRKFSHYQYDPKNRYSLASDDLRSVFVDRGGVLWIGTGSSGLNKLNRVARHFEIYQAHSDKPSSLSSNFIGGIYEDSKGAVWIGGYPASLNKLDRKTGQVTIYAGGPDHPDGFSGEMVTSIVEGENGNLWIGVLGGGLFQFNPETEKFTPLKNNPSNSGSPAGNSILALYKDRSGSIWVGYQHYGLDRLDPATGQFIHYPPSSNNPNSLSNGTIYSIFEDSSGAIWVGTAEAGVSKLDPSTGQFVHYRHDPNDPGSLSSDQALTVFEDSRGQLWVGTLGGGLNRFDPQTGAFKHYTEENDLPNNTVYGILEDSRHFLWLSTNQGLSRFDPTTETFRNFDVKDGLQSNEFNSGAYMKSRSGDLFFGGVEGLTVFRPESIVENPYLPPVVVTAFKKFNETVQVDVPPGEPIQLSYRDNFISFEFAALDYNDSAKNEYVYKLEGFDRDWISAGNRRYASYTNLKGGQYLFRVRGSNSDGAWNEGGVSIPITITPPVWETWWFRSLSLAGLAGILMGGYRLRVKRIEDQKRVLEKQVQDRTFEIERRRRAAEGMRDILAVLNSNQPPRDILGYIIDRACRLTGANAGTIDRFDLDENLSLPEASFGMPFTYRDLDSVPILPWGPQEAVLNRQPSMINDLSVLCGSAKKDGSSLDPRLAAWIEIHCQNFEAQLSVPIITNDQVYGSLSLCYCTGRDFSQEEIDLAVSLADQAALAIENARLRSQAEQLAVAAERSRLARDLHDAVTQTLFSASLIAEVLPRIWERTPEEGLRRLEELRQLNRGALAEMRSLLLELRPATLEEANLPELFQHLSDAFTGRARIPVHLLMEGDVSDEPALPADIKVTLYRIAQEALNNIAKHASATNVTLRLVCDPHSISVCIEDDGCGFDPNRVSADHLGLGIMRERAASAGVELYIHSQKDRGAQVLAVWERQNGAGE